MSAELPGIGDWRKLVSDGLKGRDFDSLRSKTSDGIVIEPLYERQRDAEPLLGRGALPWTIVQPVDNPDPDKANEQAIADIKGGATGLSLRFADSFPAATTGLPAAAGVLEEALDGVDLAKVHIRLEPHADVFRSAVSLHLFAEKSGVAPELARISFGLDPLSFAESSADTTPQPEQFAGVFSYLRSRRYRGPLVCLDARVFHEAGASEAQELAGVLALAAWWLRELDETGVGSPADVMQHFGASLSVDRDLLVSLAKLRAARLLWARFQEVCGAPFSLLPIHAETSRRMLTRVDPHANLLRNTLAALAAAVSGADSILVHPHTAALGPANPEARALARNIQHLLMQESHLDRVADPGAGSGAIEALTNALGERAWAEFQQIERESGIIASFGSGAFPARIGEARAALVTEVASGAAPLVGSTLHTTEPGFGSDGEPTVKAPRGLAPIRLELLAKAAA
jgi:methylmalonyl-CoA mutase